MQNIKSRIQNFPVKLTKNENGVFLLIGENMMKIPNSVVSGDFDSIDGSLSLDVIFSLKYNSKMKKYVVKNEGDDTVTMDGVSFKFDSATLENLMESPEFYEQFYNKEDLFNLSVNNMIQERIDQGEFDEHFGRQGLDWEDDEELVAKNIFILSADQPQITRIAKFLSKESSADNVLDAEDEMVLNKIIGQCSPLGIDKVTKRSWSSIKMKAYQFDEDTGFKNVSNSVKENLK